MNCAVRAAYEGLIKQLERSFEVDVLDAFAFVTRDEVHGDDALSQRVPIHRVVSWSLEDTAELRHRREREAALEHEERARAELANTTATHGFSLDEFVGALARAAIKKTTGLAPSSENINRNTAKNLRDAGFKVHAGDVRRFRGHLESYMPHILPEPLRVELPVPPAAEHDTNVLRFPSAENGDV